MNKIFDLAKTQERTWGTLAGAIDGNFEQVEENQERIASLEALKPTTPSISNDNSSDAPDLAIADEQGNTLVHFSGGHLKTKNFDTLQTNTNVAALQEALDTLVGSEDTTAVIDTFNEVIAFLNGVTNTETLTGKLLELRDVIKTGYKYFGKAGTEADFLTGVTFDGSQGVFYLAVEAGTYEAFGNKQVTADQAPAFLMRSATATSWSVEPLMEARNQATPTIQATADADLDIADEEGNVIARFKDGHFRTKNFNSATGGGGNVSAVSGTSADLDIADESGNVIMRLSGGHVKTKNFDSSTSGGGSATGKKTDCTGTSYNTTNPIYPLTQEYSMASILHTWGFIGDSLCSGEMVNVKNGVREYTDMYEYSWGQRLMKIIGAEGTNFSYGGQSAKGWIDASTTSSLENHGTAQCWEGAKKDPKQAYIIALGVNDMGKNMYALGSFSTDIGTYTASADSDTNAKTFCGYYAGIIQRLQSIQPRARIFVVTNPLGTSAFNQQIRAIPTYFSNVYVLDMAQYAPSYSSSEWEQYMMFAGHMTAAGYQYTAMAFAQYIDWIIRNNYYAFRDVAFIGTDKQM